MNERDRALDDAALMIESPDPLDLMGCMARTKKGQREYETRIRIERDVKRRLAGYIRSMKSGQGNDLRVALTRLAERIDAPVYNTREVWRMADMGWVSISVTIPVTDNTIPARAEHRATITRRGQRVIEELRTETAQNEPKAA